MPSTPTSPKVHHAPGGSTIRAVSQYVAVFVGMWLVLQVTLFSDPITMTSSPGGGGNGGDAGPAVLVQSLHSVPGERADAGQPHHHHNHHDNHRLQQHPQGGEELEVVAPPRKMQQKQRKQRPPEMVPPPPSKKKQQQPPQKRPQQQQQPGHKRPQQQEQPPQQQKKKQQRPPQQVSRKQQQQQPPQQQQQPERQQPPKRKQQRPVQRRREEEKEEEEEQEEGSSSRQQEQVLSNNAPPPPTADSIDESFQVIFSTDCSPGLDWQSTLVFLSAQEVGHKGPITRIASGCNLEEQERVKGTTDKLDNGRGQFRVHFTPDYSVDKLTGERYVYYNKPHGLLHWMTGPSAPPEESIVALIDPDFIFMKPLTSKVASEDILYGHKVQDVDVIEEVEEGRPVAQKFLIGSEWTRFNLSYIAGEDSPSRQVGDDDAWRYYVVGPPYILHRRDALQIAIHWSEFVPKVHEEYPHLLGEMFAYSIAAAHLRLPHLVLDNYMTSNPDAWGEAWPFVDNMPTDKMCAMDLSGSGYKLPGFLHLCQWYKPNSETVFWKRDVPNDIFSCEPKPLPMAKDSLVQEIDRNVTLGAQGADMAKYHLFQYCQLAFKLNKAQEEYKHLMCE